MLQGSNYRKNIADRLKQFATFLFLRSAPGSLRRTSGMDGQGKSDRLIVPWTPANKDGGAPSPVERVEGTGLAKGNAARRRKFRTQSRSGVNMANRKRAPTVLLYFEDRGDSPAVWYAVLHLPRRVSPPTQTGC